MEHLPALANLSTFRVPWGPPSDLGQLVKHPNLRLIELPDRPAHKPIPGALSFNEELNRWSKPSTLREATQLQQIIICPQSEYMRRLAERVPYEKIPTTAFSQTVPVNPDLCKELAKLPNLTATFGMWMLALGMVGRRPLLSQELMRPVNRQEFTSNLTWSLWHDFWPGLLIALGYAVCIPLVLPLAPENSILNTPLLSSYVVYCLASAVFIWLAMLLAMTIQRTWLRTFTLILVGIVEMVSLQFGAIAITVGDRLVPISWVIPEILLGFLLVTAIIGWLAFRRLPQVEWGRQS